MKQEFILELYKRLTPEARSVFDTLTRLNVGTMEQIMREGNLTTQEVRKGIWGLASTGLITHRSGTPIRLSEDGTQLVKLLHS